MKYHCGVIYTAVQWITIEAENQEAAEEKALNQGGQGLCNHCSGIYDLEDPTGEVIVNWFDRPL